MHKKYILKLLYRLTKLFSSQSNASNIDVLREEFQLMFDCFKQLIATNRDALENMTEISEALREGMPVGMTFVRSRCKRVSRNVFSIIDLLNRLSKNSYSKLYEKFREIESRIEPMPGNNPSIDSENFILSLREIDLNYTDQVGEKMSNLGEIHNSLHLNVPQGFIITANAYWHFMELTGLQMEIDEILSTVSPREVDKIDNLSTKIQNLIIDAELPVELEASIVIQIKDIFKKADKTMPFAVRSSAQGEGLPGKSCAGMYLTRLGVYGHEVIKVYKEILASKYGPRAIIYRLNNGINDKDVAMCVGCIPLIKAKCGGVVYSRNPLNIRDKNIQIHSIFGLPSIVVDGSADSDLVVVSRKDPINVIKKEIALKKNQYIFDENRGIIPVELSKPQQSFLSIEEDMAVELAKQVKKIEKHFATSQDIEWVIDKNNSIIFLQSRALLLRECDNHITEDEDIGHVLATGRVTASSGSASGTVHIVNKREDVFNIPENSVLVFKLPVTNWAIGIKRASAIIAEQGGVAGHFANVARELNVPALFGVRDAMRRFKGGEIITVDADRKKIFRGTVEKIIHKPETLQTSIRSKGFRILEKASKHITPLNLLDPGDHTKFTPDNCKSFHDITRFCHEKSIQEMYNFGTKHNFPERSAKRLYVNTPTQFWIIDLADGFKPGAAKGKYIKLKDVVSAPMQALWHGMTTIPWDMPQLDTRGFLEILMESTMNTGLNYSVSSPYTKKNYFMVTRKYCSSHIH
ncbi:MAG: PEP/pyruvate-binding domain-containing protein, partial [Chitinispirillia bacterium]